MVLITPLAVWQTVGSGYRLTWTDVLIVLISGLVYTALCFSLFSDGLRYVRVEHAGILGYLEPVTAPLWAFLLIGEAPPWTTYAGGALIVAAGHPRDRLRQGRGREARGAADVSGGRAAPSAAPAAGATASQSPERMRGYLEVGLASLANGSIGVMVTYADMPATMLLCLRMVFAAAALGVVVLATGSWRDLRTPGAPLRVLGISIALSLNLILYFLAIRYTGVAVAIFLSYLAPVYLAFVAPRILKEKTERGRVRRPRDRPGRHGADPRAGLAPRGRRSFRPPGCSAAGGPGSCTRCTCCSPRACAV